MSLDVKTAILLRHSIRRFSSKAIEASVLLELVELARLYASGGNIQPVRFSILSAPPYKDQLFHFLHWAAYIPGFSISAEERPPAYIILLRDTKISNGCSFEIGAAATTLMLAAQEYGLATCCVGNFSAKSVSELLSIPAEYAPELILAIGYSSLSYNYYVACQVESKLRKKKATTAEHALFMFRAPKIR